MTTRTRRRVLLLLGVVSLAVVLCFPGVHWRLIGWARGEAFYRDRPTTYWRSEIDGCDKWLGHPTCGFASVAIPKHIPQYAPIMWLRRRKSTLDCICHYATAMIGRPDLYNTRTICYLEGTDEAALPVLMDLLNDPDPAIRYFSARKITDLRESGRPALSILKQLVGDKAVAIEDITVADAVAYPVYMLEHDEWRK